tara:strand:+ start:1011 stop:2099 length:1089 start_codon:yes stop_codon:yes gene_type:complete
MNKVVLNYILYNFLKTFLGFVAVAYCFGLILNLFEEIEFFKNIDVQFFTPIVLTGIYVPSMIIEVLPFIIFFSSLWFMLKIRNNKDLLTLKIFGYSNLKIFFILALTSFLIGWIVLIVINPITSSMFKYYEKTKSNYSRDIDHLITFNKNGMWIKENIGNQKRIISAKKPEGQNLIDVTIFQLDENYNLVEKIISKKANISKSEWELSEVRVFKPIDGIMKSKKLTNYKINSIYNYEKINSLFKNLNTISFLDLILRYKKLLNNGYNKIFLNESLQTMLTLPFFLFLMTGLAAILSMGTLKRSENVRFYILGIIVSIIIFYLKDLSIALGQTDRIPIILSIWTPILALSFFIFIGILQINEK